VKLEDRERGLLKLVDEYREQECRRMLEAARAEARALIAQAYHKQRALLHTRVVAERGQAQARIQAARAEKATRGRRVSDRANMDLLVAAWPLLRARLASTWSNPRGRRAWTGRFLSDAMDLLPKGRWEIRHAGQWAESERQELLPALEQHLGQSPRFETDGRIEAGLIIACEGAVLDASLDGLLQDRPRLEARLLALLEEH
jgi:hypothetical protein